MNRAKQENSNGGMQRTSKYGPRRHNLCLKILGLNCSMDGFPRIQTTLDPKNKSRKSYFQKEKGKRHYFPFPIIANQDSKPIFFIYKPLEVQEYEEYQFEKCAHLIGIITARNKSIAIIKNRVDWKRTANM